MINKICKIILFSPILLLKKIFKLFKDIFTSVHMSIRRKIMLDFLLIYIFVSIISTIFVPTWFLYVEIDTKSFNELKQINQSFIEYTLSNYNTKDLEIKLGQIYSSEDISIKVNINKLDLTTNSKYNSVVKSGYFETFDYSKNLIDKITLLLKNQLLSKHIGNLRINSKDAYWNFDVYGLYPIRLFQKELVGLTVIMTIFHIIGLIFILIISEARIRNILSPISDMTITAKQLSLSNLDKRLDEKSAKYELRDLAKTINNFLDRLDLEYARQKRFVSDVSHELRTPISIINGYVSMLKRWGMNDQEILDESIVAISAEVENMQKLIENLLMLARFDNQTLVYEFSEFDLNELLIDIVKEFNVVNKKNQIIEYIPTKEIIVNLDSSKIKQLLRIFIDNAIKYTKEEGKITIKAVIVKQNVLLVIKDNGIGISESDIANLFERFYRSDESRARESGGYGLGLSIAKVIIASHKGEISVNSQLNKGTTFTIKLPTNNK